MVPVYSSPIQLTSRSRGAAFGVVLVVFVLAGTTIADAKLTPAACLVQKHKAWDALRKCQRGEQVRQLQGKTVDLAKCEDKFQTTFAKIDAKAAKAATPCRFGDQDDGTVTDYDTGLQWEKKSPGTCSNALIACASDADCQPFTCVAWARSVNKTYTWAEAESFVSGFSTDTTTIEGSLVGLGGFSDWRLPTITELLTIVDMGVPGCGSNGVECINPAFGLTADAAWSSTSYPASPPNAWFAIFNGNGTSLALPQTTALFARGVRRAL